VSWIVWFALVVAVALLVYLIVALLKPELFL
jgi:K+-transporting ATPase KdpF subunit